MGLQLKVKLEAMAIPKTMPDHPIHHLLQVGSVNFLQRTGLCREDMTWIDRLILAALLIYFVQDFLFALFIGSSIAHQILLAVTHWFIEWTPELLYRYIFHGFKAFRGLQHTCVSSWVRMSLAFFAYSSLTIFQMFYRWLWRIILECDCWILFCFFITTLLNDISFYKLLSIFSFNFYAFWNGG